MSVVFCDTETMGTHTVFDQNLLFGVSARRRLRAWRQWAGSPVSSGRDKLPPTPQRHELSQHWFREPA